jgi:hypothetical protein
VSRAEMVLTQIKRRIRNFGDKETLLFGTVYFFWSLINLSLKIRATPNWYVTLQSNHESLVAFTYSNNEQSRIFQFLIPELFIDLFHMTTPHAYAMSRLLFVFLSFVFFHKFLRKWFSKAESFCGVAVLSSILPYTYMNHLQESAPLLMFLFLLALTAIRDDKKMLLVAVLFLGGFTNETLLIMPAVYFFYHFKKSEIKENFLAVLHSLLLGLPMIAVVCTIRYLTRDNPHLSEYWHIADNLAGIWRHLGFNFFDWHKAYYLSAFIMYGAMWIFAFLGFKSKPLFLRRSSLIIPIFIFCNFTAGIIAESRLMIPISLLIIPMAMFYLFKSQQSN